jgi:2'-5' RNA ligase
MRAFIAIELPPTVRESLVSLRDRFRKSDAAASWVKDDNLHLTLRFLGDVPEPDLARLSEYLAEKSAACAPLRLCVCGAGAFPNPRRPSVVWVGVETLSGDLIAIQAHTENAARSIGLPPEPKPFHPHITLARIRDARRLGTLPAELDAAKSFLAGEFDVPHMALFSSTLTPRGPIYRCLREFKFGCLSQDSG